MQPDYYNNLDKIIEKIWAMLTEAVENRDFPFHIPVFICGSKNNFDGRIVVLRGVDKKNRTIKFHSDVRSIKIKIIKKFSPVSFLFYDKSQKIQLRILGNAKVNYNNRVTKESWRKTAHMSRKCYLAGSGPGTKKQNPTSGLNDDFENLKYTMEESEKGYKNFSVIETKINSIEWLFLAVKGHRRAKFNYKNGNIKKYWLTP